jgi:hypothetical protein
MPIRRYLGEGGVFSPKTISEMSRALGETCERLGISGEKQRQAVAKFIIRLAGEDNSLDAAALRTGRSWPWEVSHIPPPFPPARIPHRTPPLSEKKSPSAGER